MKILVLADDDGVRRSLPDEAADVVIACGDLLDAVILEAAQRTQSGNVLAVKGNHDGSGDFEAPIRDLHLAVVTVDGVRFGGFRGSWKYKPRGNYLYEQEEVAGQLAGFPAVDVFVAHNSPRGVHDRDDEVHHGFEAFGPYIERAEPRLLIHGHQHVNRETMVGETRVVGVYGLRWLEC
jgi:Icc-related predicted phosphoesterase